MVVINVPRCHNYWSWLHRRLALFHAHVKDNIPLPPEAANLATEQPVPPPPSPKPKSTYFSLVHELA